MSLLCVKSEPRTYLVHVCTKCGKQVKSAHSRCCYEATRRPGVMAAVAVKTLRTVEVAS